MYSLITGITDTDNIAYCPMCGAKISIFYGDGTAKCDECNFHFGVVECEKE